MSGDKGQNQNIQDVFLNKLRKQKAPVTVFLGNGVKLQGIVTSFDNFCLVLKRGPQIQLVYKHSVATVVPAPEFKLFDTDEDEHVEETEAA